MLELREVQVQIRDVARPCGSDFGWGCGACEVISSSLLWSSSCVRSGAIILIEREKYILPSIRIQL